MKTCIVQITRVASTNRIYAIEVDPDPCDIELPATISSPIPLTNNSAGVYSTPKVEPGIKAVAIKYEYQFIITGFFKEYAPQLGSRSSLGVPENTDEAGVTLRSNSSSRISLFSSGKIDIFANIWARMHISQIKEFIDAYFRKFRFKWFGGEISSVNEQNTTVVLSQGYQNPKYDDQAEGFSGLPTMKSDPTALNADEYVNKVIVTNVDTPMRVETRQNTAGIKAPLPYMRDVFTIEQRGHQGDDAHTIYSIDTVDRSRGTRGAFYINESGLNYNVKKYNPALPDPEAVAPQWLANMHLGETVNLQYVAPGTICSIDMLDETYDYLFGLTCNDYSMRIGESFSISKNTDSAGFDIRFNADGTAFIRNDQFTLSTTQDNVVRIEVATGGSLLVGADGDVTLSEDTQGQDNVLTPNSIFGGSVVYDTFTGLPFQGSKTMAVKSGKP